MSPSTNRKTTCGKLLLLERYSVYGKGMFGHEIHSLSLIEYSRRKIDGVNMTLNTTPKRIIVLVKKITTTDIIDEKMEIVQAGYQTLKEEREQIQKELESESIERDDRIRLVHSDKAKAIEQKRLVSIRDQLLKRREVILEAEAAEVDEYNPEDVEW